jgi:hypothetical protein
MTPFRFLVRFVIFVLVFLVLAEGWLRYVTPASEQPAQHQDRVSLVYSFDPHAARSGLFTVGRIPRRAATWHVNDAGWLSPVRYSRRVPGSALIALFGDSYVEGFEVPQSQHLDVNLRQQLGPRVGVYAFGMSGWYLEQYVATARYVRAAYDPSLIVILTGEGDVSASLRSNGGATPYCYQIAQHGSGYQEVPPTHVYMRSRLSNMAHKSALVRYLRYNAHLQLPGAGNNDIQGAPTNAAADAGAQAATSDSASAQSEQALVAKALPAARFLVGRLCANNPDVPIIFAARGPRYLPVDAVSGAPLQPEMEALREACAGHAQCHFLSLTMAFSLDWARHHERFEAIDGAHYNAHAYSVAAQAIAAYIDAHGLLASSTSARGSGQGGSADVH